MPNPSTRQSGEHRMPDGASEDVRVLAATVQLGIEAINGRLDSISDQTERRADKIDLRLEQGAVTMTQMSTTLARVTETLERHSESINNLQVKGADRLDRTPRANPALQPLKDPEKEKMAWYWREAIRATITVVVTGVVILLLGHGPAIARAFAGSGVSP